MLRKCSYILIRENHAKTSVLQQILIMVLWSFIKKKLKKTTLFLVNPHGHLLVNKEHPFYAVQYRTCLL